ncbi:MAG: hypothetical protein N2C14_24005, partial [Planctomycetales bacterium]
VHWMEPRYLDFAHISLRLNDDVCDGLHTVHGSRKDSLVIGFADGSVHCMNAEKLGPNRLKSLLTVDGGEKIDSSD